MSRRPRDIRRLRRFSIFGDEAGNPTTAPATPPPASAASALSDAATKAAASDQHPAVATALANAAAVATGSDLPAPPPTGPAAASALALASVASAGADHPEVTKALGAAAITANAGSGAGVPAPAPPPSAAPALAEAAKDAKDDHPAVATVLANAAATSTGKPAPLPAPVGPDAAKALTDAAKSSEGDHPAVTAALVSGAAVASGDKPPAAILANAAQSAASQGAHPAVTVALANASALAAGATPPKPPPVGPDAAQALVNSAATAQATDAHPIVVAELAKAAVAADPTVANKENAPAVGALAAAAKSAGAVDNPKAADLLANAAASNLPPAVPGAPVHISETAGAPLRPGEVVAPPPAPFYPGGSPSSPVGAPPPPPPALANLPAEHVAAVQGNVLQNHVVRETTDLQPGDAMARGEVLASHEADEHGHPRWKLVFQRDGDLVMYDGVAPIWTAGAAGSGAVHAKMRDDGGFVLEDEGGRIVWGTGTHGADGAFLVLQDDGTFGVFQGRTPLWFSHLESRKPPLHRVNNIFLGGVRHHGKNRHQFQFGEERMNGLFQRLGHVTAMSIPHEHRRGFDHAMVVANGRYTPAEIRALLSDYTPADRAGFAAGVALKKGVGHPDFARFVATAHTGFGFDWSWFGRWFHKGKRGKIAPPPPPVAQVVQQIASAPPSPPPPPPPPDPSAPSPSGATIADPVLLPDGSNVPLPSTGFSDWNTRRNFEMQARARWESAHGLPARGLPSLADPYHLPDGSAIPLPLGGFRDWPSRQAWELSQRNVWQEHGAHPLARPSAAMQVARDRRGFFHGDFGAPYIAPPTGVDGVSFAQRAANAAAGIPNAPTHIAAPPPPPVVSSAPYVHVATGAPYIPHPGYPAPPPPPAPYNPGYGPSYNAPFQGGMGPGWGGGFADAALQVADQSAFDAEQATDDAANGILPPPVVSAAGQFIPAAAAGLGNAIVPYQGGMVPHRGERHFWDSWFHGDFGADAPQPSATAAAQQLAGVAIGIGAQTLGSSDAKAAASVAAKHPHLLAGLVKTGGSALHYIEAWWHTLIYPSKKDPVSGVTTIAPIEIKG